MGYYTKFQIKEATNEQAEDLKQKSGYAWYDDELHDVKWYGWKEDLERVSRRFPTTPVVLTGVGEDHPDLWQATALGGKVTVKRGRIVYD